MNRVLVLSVVAAVVLEAGCGAGSNTSAHVATREAAPKVQVATVISQKLAISAHLPGELSPYESVSIFPKVNGFVKWIGVDRGSHVRSGELLARLEAPELVAQRAEAQAKLQQAESQLSAGQAKLASDESTYEHLKAAAATPGVVAGNDLVVAEKASEADRAQVKAQQQNVNAARQALASVTQTEQYLEIKAPFDGIVTERNVHPGALVGPAGAAGGEGPMLKIETLSRLRLTVAVPETYAAGVPDGTKVEFLVASFPGRAFSGKIARISHAVDIKTRTMPVELDVSNVEGELAPGTFADVSWPVRRSYPTLFVPTSAVATTLERVFVVRIRDGKTEWVDVKTGVNAPKQVEVFGDLHEGDKVALRGTDELHPGTAVTTEAAHNN
jgi:membrane fusion protein, multidrug efflux system